MTGESKKGLVVNGDAGSDKTYPLVMSNIAMDSYGINGP
jgi:hypothetical protein